VAFHGALVKESGSRPNAAKSVREEYLRHLTARRAEAVRQDRWHSRIAVLRLAVFAGAGIIAWLAFHSNVLSPWSLVVPAVLFFILVAIHERVDRARCRMERAAAFYERGFARLDSKWMGRGEKGVRFDDTSHPYAEDLDIFGQGSLFELLCTARTQTGEETLASWLKQGAMPEEIRQRQEAVRELSSNLQLREDIAVYGDEGLSEVNPAGLSAWGTGQPILLSKAARAVAAALAALALSSLIGWSFLATDRLWFFSVLLLEGVFYFWLRHPVKQVLEAAERAGQNIDLLSQILARLEEESFCAPLLARLRSDLDSHGLCPSAQISRLHRLFELLDSGRNQFFAPIAMLLLWPVQLAFALESWRHKSGHAVERWLAAVGKMEALSALAGYAYEHPDDPFPEILEAGTCFEARGIGHPLIPEDRCVRNDLLLCGDLRVLVLSGSNMSGKSTLLRAMGTNAVLALAGAPVRARALRLSPLSLGASIRVMDSLQAGSSRFYAEITRLRQLVDLTKNGPPLLFLLDELLHGTNSHDRCIGAEAIVRGLVERGAIGVLTTHDLALAHIADILAPAASNVHFEDFMQDGKIVFDYRLKPGVVTHSNALELMRSIGLDV